MTVGAAVGTWDFGLPGGSIHPPACMFCSFRRSVLRCSLDMACGSKSCALSQSSSSSARSCPSAPSSSFVIPGGNMVPVRNLNTCSVVISSSVVGGMVGSSDPREVRAARLRTLEVLASKTCSSQKKVRAWSGLKHAVAPHSRHRRDLGNWGCTDLCMRTCLCARLCAGWCVYLRRCV